jgi:hypothetical protein
MWFSYNAGYFNHLHQHLSSFDIALFGDISISSLAQRLRGTATFLQCLTASTPMNVDIAAIIG